MGGQRVGLACLMAPKTQKAEELVLQAELERGACLPDVYGVTFADGVL
jgi:hypothetical protein